MQEQIIAAEAYRLEKRKEFELKLDEERQRWEDIEEKLGVKRGRRENREYEEKKRSERNVLLYACRGTESSMPPF